MVDSRNLKALRQLKKKLILHEFERGEVASVLEVASDPKTSEERDIVARCHYELAKVACAHEDFGEARTHAVAVEQLKPSDRSIRALNSERLKLLCARPAVMKMPNHFFPGVVDVDEIGSVAVLGKYEARGHKSGLTEAILLLKKAPEEMDDASRAARPELIDRLGLLMWDLLRATPIAETADLLIPVPPDPERFALRTYHPPDAIAKALSKYSIIPQETDVLVKLRPTKSLRELNREERERELRGSMAVANERDFLVRERCVLLVDDVVTWGTHFREARNVLLHAGARCVHAIALATAHGYPDPIWL